MCRCPSLRLFASFLETVEALGDVASAAALLAANATPPRLNVPPPAFYARYAELVRVACLTLANMATGDADPDRSARAHLQSEEIPREPVPIWGGGRGGRDFGAALRRRHPPHGTAAPIRSPHHSRSPVFGQLPEGPEPPLHEASARCLVRMLAGRLAAARADVACAICAGLRAIAVNDAMSSLALGAAGGPLTGPGEAGQRAMRGWRG